MVKRHFGSARELPSGRWQARYRDPEGRRRTAPMTFKNKRDAVRWLTLKEAEIARGEWLDPDAGKTMVKDWSARWLASAGPSLKPKTRALYASLIKTQIEPAFGVLQVAEVRPIAVSEWVARMVGRGLSPSRIRQAYIVLSQIMTSAVDNDLIKASPCRGVKLPRLPQTEPRILTPEEVDRLVSSARRPHDLLVQLLAFGGLRVGEAFALRRAHLDLDNGRLRVAEAVVEIAGKHVFGSPKSHQRREITLPAFLVDRLRAHLADLDQAPETLLFTGRTGKAFHYNSWRRWYFDPAAEKAGLVDVTPHDLRATHATWVADRHGVMAAARRLGHSNASVTTRHYARAVEARDAEIADALDRKPPGARKEGAGGPGARVGHGGDEEAQPTGETTA
ncbi:site-specific integrase [Actinomadura craniellae]|uniref:Site-specific integrase n=1 Tax=Actinomadura craniellae TaxID=2231787 RepID=A0A365H7W9_9ACTN|nr:site-specific integrase [Actinomadura craniellae]RAY15205.1 site-specific integrase [Actinomadura craniellae]